jgi:TPR repeat protein
MKKSITLSTLLLCSFISIAQTVPFEILEKFSKEINILQKNANGKIYTDGKTYYEVTFPETSFDVSFHNQLATKVVYKKWEGKEIMAITDNIDLSKAQDIKVTAFGGLAGAMRIYFPNNTIKTQLYENGKLINTINETYVEIFYDKSSDNDKLICIAKINELISIIKETQNKPFDSWLLQSYYYNMFAYNSKYKMIDKYKVEGQLDKLIAINNKYALESKGFDLYYNDKDYENAKKYLQKAVDLGNYDGYIWLGNIVSNKELPQKAVDLNGFQALDNIAQYKYAWKLNYTQAIYYAEKAIKIGHPFFRKTNSALLRLFSYYIKNSDFEKVKELLMDEKTYSSGLSEIDIMNINYDLLTESGNCNEAVAFLNQMANGVYTNEVKYQVYEKLEYLYNYGCKGTNGNKVKTNKKLANETANKKYSLPKK